MYTELMLSLFVSTNQLRIPHLQVFILFWWSSMGYSQIQLHYKSSI